MDLVHSPGDPTHREVVLRPHQPLHVELRAGGGPWHGAASSAPALVGTPDWLPAADGGACFVVIGHRLGTATVTVRGEGATLTLAVSVAPYPIAG